MSLVLVSSDVDRSVSVLDMKEGQIAKIVSWSCKGYEGNIVTRFKNTLIHIGGSNGDCWTDIFKTLKGQTKQMCRVEILQNGTLLKVENNE